MDSGTGMTKLPGGVKISSPSKWQVQMSQTPTSDHFILIPASVSGPPAHLGLLSKDATGRGLSPVGG